MAAIISGKVFDDANHNGVYNSGESGIPNVYVTLYNSTSQSCISTQTDSLGDYSFSVAQAGSYTIYETVTNINSSCPPTNFTQPSGFTMSNGPRKTTLTVTQTQINNNTTIGNNNFSHDTIDNQVACTDSFIQFAGNPSNWYEINVVTGESVLKTALIPANYVNAIGYNPLDSYIYGYNQTTNSIVRVDDSGNIITLKPNPPGLPTNGYTTGTFDTNGFLYIFVNDGTRFYTIDLRPNSATFMKLVNPTNGYLEQTSNFGVALNPAVNVSDWSYNPIDGNLYGVTSTGILARINPTIGVTTNLITTGATNGPFGAQAIDAHGNIYAISNRDGNIYKYTISGNNATGTYFSSTVITSNNDGTICPNTAINVDFGDAPDVSPGNGPNDYNTLLANNGPRHQIREGLYLGHLITSESDAYQNATATGDDLILDIQDDALTTPLTPISSSDTTYSLLVEVTNNTGENANLYGWIDFNENGLFEENESVTTVVPPNGLQTIPLVFNVPAGSLVSSGSTFLRLRLTTDNLTNSGTSVQDDRSVGPASDGEVEDYILDVAVSADLAVTKIGNPNPAIAGEELTYIITVVNNGPDTAVDVNVIDAIPIELDNPEYSLDGGGTWNPWPGTYSLGDLINGEIRTILIRGAVNHAAQGSIKNTVTVTSPTPDPDPGNNTDTIEIPIEASADISVVKLGSPKPVISGEELTYTITVSNAGPSAATDVLVEDNVSPELSNVEYSINGGGTWNPWPGNLIIGSLSPGEVFLILIRGVVNSDAQGNIQNTVTVTSPTPDPDPGNNTDTDDTRVQTLADLMLSKTADSDIVNAGGTLIYTIKIINNGPSDSQNVILEDIIPPELQNPEYSLDGVNYNSWPGNINLGNIISGDTLSVFIRSFVALDATGSIINTATVTSDTPDPDPGNNTDTVIVGISASADLAVTKVGNPDPVTNGDPLTYTVTVVNNGPSEAENVLVEDNVPSVLLNPEYSLDGVNYSPWPGSLNLGNLVNGQSQVILIRGTVNSASNTAITNTVTVTSDTPDPDISNNTDTAIVGVDAAADLAITKTANPDPVIAGNLITYTLNIINNGPSDAQNIVVTDNTAQDILNPEYSLDGVNYSPWPGSLNLGNLGNGGTVQVLIRGTVNPSTLNNNLANTATITSDTPDPDPSNNIDDTDTPINTSADLAVTKTSSPSPVKAGDPLTYTITITNNGPSDATNVNLIDAVPVSVENPVFSVDGGITFNPWSSPYIISRVGAGEVITVLIEGTVAAATTNSIVNTFVVASNTPDPDLSNNTDTEITPVTPSADISISKNALTNPVKVGDMVMYDIIVNNAGPSTSTTISLYDIVPPEISNPEISLDGGTTWESLTNPFNIGDLAKGETQAILVRGILTETDKNILANNALVMSPTPDPDITNNIDDEEIVITPVVSTADISVVKSAPRIAAIGSLMTYTITVSNAGPSIAENVTLTDILSSALSNGSFSLDGGNTFTRWPGSFNLGSLAINETIQVLIRGLVNENACNLINNTATVSSTTPDPNPDNNISRTVTEPIRYKTCKPECQKPKKC